MAKRPQSENCSVETPSEFPSSSQVIGPHHVQCHPWCMDFIVAHRAWILFSAGFWLKTSLIFMVVYSFLPNLVGEERSY